MTRIPAGNLFASASSIGGACKFFQVGRRQLWEQGDFLLVVRLGDIMVTIRAAKLLKDAAADLGFVASAADDDDFGRIMDSFPTLSREGLQSNDRRLAESMGALDYLLKTVRDEVDARPMFIMAPGAVDLPEQGRQPLDPKSKTPAPLMKTILLKPPDALRCNVTRRASCT